MYFCQQIKTFTHHDEALSFYSLGDNGCRCCSWRRNARSGGYSLAAQGG